MTAAPRASGLLPVGSGERMYWEEWGNPEGAPALFLHGGPGGTLRGSEYRHRFDLQRTRLVSFEQRGCGRSTPHAGDPATPLRDNTSAALVGDIEALRTFLGIGAWVVSGVSWGSTLALAYAVAHPDRVRGVVLYAVTTTSAREVEWITEGVGAIFPEAWDRLATHAEEAGIGYRRGEARLVDAYDALLNSPDLAVVDEASREWALWEDTHVSIAAGGFARDPHWEDDAFRRAFSRLAVHYWANAAFLDRPLLERAEELRGIPGQLIHGRRDLSSPAVTAWELHRRWPASTLFVDDSGGHGGSSMARRWREANDAMTGGGS